jgi:hypothetical protein
MPCLILRLFPKLLSMLQTMFGCDHSGRTHVSGPIINHARHMESIPQKYEITSNAKHLSRGQDRRTNHLMTLNRLLIFLIVISKLENHNVQKKSRFLLDLCIVELFVQISKNTRSTLTY